MSFHASSEDIRLEDGHILFAKCRDEEGDYHGRTLDLDRFIGNSDGWFQWDGENFSYSARNITLSHRSDGLWLEAELPKRDGGYRERQGINLSARITNRDGRLGYN